ncbi:diphosphomevalonate decarboxylase [Blastomyces dermatitidis]|uniref:Diphosphomevalonate decarboxylase n=3 Tax=Blastomyces TaxID=229219 RepID=A0A179UFC2_BLAGS|nr:diphosphomevalonate decarboxylase [Blastomyces gilchristii SLH14081]XP_045275042.1 diphosphomevalonate decarboxylase [Blastomyces dermatitidis ER-3]EGE79187.1 diphosphomevalonate decarboxylase [Blastomyces dermatitidis ATCC 18188]EQL32176.1 diphosphomevalonate decarboxylase [Blastomyces dermatitidis ATCC 26199]EEQ87785.1 diphosphomevalonate decarboxylase [Blastomyces dermatitidis ER-3]OAT06443.1 diphosphomevalonate decarboxylase [Blastomyces gilchristii SLH14081]
MAGSTEVYRASATAPVNIAVIKYWGKRDAILNLPTNSSLSVTLSQSSLRAYTTASCSPTYPAEDSLTLNSQPHSIKDSKRTLACLSDLRSLRQELENANPSLPKLSTFPLRIVSENNFPTAAGLASSAAGFAALVRAVANLYELPQSPSDLSRIARQGSGSACRSMMGGYVAWRTGVLEDGTDSLAEEVAPASHWPEMRALILVVSDVKKDVPSTLGMQATVATSTLFATRAETVVPARMVAIETAIKNRDFPSFAEITMKDSNNFHATNLDTWPPTFYLNDVSRAAIRLVHDINRAAGETICAYTFDAGPNAVIYYLNNESERVIGTFRSILKPETKGWDGVYGDAVKHIKSGILVENLDPRAVAELRDGINTVILTGVGEGPLKADQHLVSETGEILKGSPN